MPTITVIARDGSRSQVKGIIGASLMESLRDGGIDDIQALCGGCCSCATCHVYVDEDWTAKVGGPGEDESDLLDSSDHREPNSRLSCQIDFTDALSGLKVTIAPED